MDGNIESEQSSRLQEITEEAIGLLKRIWKKWAMCLVRIDDYNPSEMRMTLVMKASRDYIKIFRDCRTLIKPVDEITGGQYDHALVQATYLLISFLIRDGVTNIISRDEYERLMRGYRINFKRKKIDYLKPTPKDDHFTIELTAKKISKSRNGIPYSVVEFGGDVMKGTVVPVARVNELNNP